MSSHGACRLSSRVALILGRRAPYTSLQASQGWLPHQPWLARGLATPSDFPKYLKSKPAVTPDFGPKADVPSIVKGVIDDIRQNGDAAVKKYSQQFDKWDPKAGFKLSREKVDEIISQVDPQIISDIKEVQKNVRKFAQAQKDHLQVSLQLNYSCHSVAV